MPGSRRTSFALTRSAEKDEAAPESLRALVVSPSDSPEQQQHQQQQQQQHPTTVVMRPTRAVAVLAPYERVGKELLYHRTANSVGGSRALPNASSESDLGRYVTAAAFGGGQRAKSPSLSQVTVDPRKDNSHSSTASKLVLKEVQSHSFKQHVGEKVAQVSTDASARAAGGMVDWCACLKPLQESGSQQRSCFQSSSRGRKNGRMLFSQIRRG